MLEQNWKSLIHFSASADNHFDPHKYSKLYGAAAALGIGGGAEALCGVAESSRQAAAVEFFHQIYQRSEN